MRFDLRLLRHALALAEHRHFARAASAMHISQPTLTRSIQELEKLCGTLLFDRDAPRGPEPTAVGSIFLARAQEVVSRADDFEREMDLMKGLEKGDLRVGSGTFTGPLFVDLALARLIKEQPSIRVEGSHEKD